MIETLTELANVAPVGTLLLALGAFVVSLLNRRHIESLHIEINSRLTQLLEATASSARAEGVAAGEQSQRDRQAPPTQES